MSAIEVLERWEERGYLDDRISRREFLKFCGRMAVLLGLSNSMIPQIAEAVEQTVQQRRPSVIWLEFQDCAGNTESFTRANSPSVSQAVLESISLDYHETLMAAAGHQAEEARQRALEENSGKLIVVVEGSIPTKDDGVYCTVGGKTALQILQEVEPHALAFVAVGTCAAFGGIPMARPNPTGAVGLESVIRTKPIINAPGCPANPDVMMGILVHYLVFGRLPELDAKKRPLFAFGKRIHDTCERRPHFDAGQFALSFDDFGARNGFCLYKLGCKGPETYNICASWRWNMGASWPVKAGHPCIGCSEPAFWDRFTPFYERIPLAAGFGVEARADDIGKVAVGVTAAGIAAHAIYTAAVRKAEQKAVELDKKGKEESNES
ncbi:MAG: twin-arginine translocation signal domain-containing protein [Calditrichaeota bacterium]|nr:MAG: twin-arginine translocation signal domain-containing protein [Calditrichota bacterium]